MLRGCASKEHRPGLLRLHGVNSAPISFANQRVQLAGRWHNMAVASWEESERRWQDRDRAWTEFAAQNRRLNDALLERHAGITAEMIASIQRSGEEHSAAFSALQSEIADQRAQIQAQTEAILQVIDRFPPQPPQG